MLTDGQIQRPHIVPTVPTASSLRTQRINTIFATNIRSAVPNSRDPGLGRASHLANFARRHAWPRTKVATCLVSRPYNAKVKKKGGKIL